MKLTQSKKVKNKIKDFENYQRFPIVINPHCVAIIRLYKRFDYLSDIGFENEQESLLCAAHYKQAARQFIKQLEGQYCESFLFALKKEICTELLRMRKRRASYGLEKTNHTNR